MPAPANAAYHYAKLSEKQRSAMDVLQKLVAIFFPIGRSVGMIDDEDTVQVNYVTNQGYKGIIGFSMPTPTTWVVYDHPDSPYDNNYSWPNMTQVRISDPVSYTRIFLRKYHAVVRSIEGFLESPGSVTFFNAGGTRRNAAARNFASAIEHVHLNPKYATARRRLNREFNSFRANLAQHAASQAANQQRVRLANQKRKAQNNNNVQQSRNRRKINNGT